MRVSATTDPGTPGKENEDWFGVTSSVAVILDGVTSPAHLGSGCVHGVPWFVRALGTAILNGCDLFPDRPLAQVLADAIASVMDLHRGTCDLTSPGTPMSTVLIVRQGHECMEYLALSDSTIVLDVNGTIRVITDDRSSRLLPDLTNAAQREPKDSPRYSDILDRLITAQRRIRNRPGGYWLAGADPSAALEALTGSVPLGSLRRAILLTDGASSLVTTYGLKSWPDLLDQVDEAGPQSVIRAVREAEATDPQGVKWPRYKRSDDATIVAASLA